MIRQDTSVRSPSLHTLWNVIFGLNVHLNKGGLESFPSSSKSVENLTGNYITNAFSILVYTTRNWD